jgi:hypothetical protein
MKTRSWEASATASINFASAAVRHAPRTSENIHHGGMVGPEVDIDAAPSPQTIVTTPATFSGGVILGDATYFPAIIYATSPNVYGSASIGNLSETMSIAINPGVTVKEVSFALFNGTSQQSYVATAYNGGGAVASQTLNNVPSNANLGYGLIDLMWAAGITSVLISPVGSPTSWDFEIDTVVFNESLTSNQSVQAAVTPLPGSWVVMLAGLALIGLMGHRRSIHTVVPLTLDRHSDCDRELRLGRA